MTTPTTPALALSLDVVVLDCPDPAALADFYARLLGWPPPSGEDVDLGEGWVNLRNPAGGVGLAFQRAADYQAPTWPDPTRPQMFHLDLAVTDLPAAREHALAAGARTLDVSPEHATFQVYADPAGHPFCLCAC
ncbi:MAG TPA: VOC family protein [Pseudonocardiaceae bacterium]|jgi:catechol 2,3-dioxygenase-like lactoylglutathione lyase family enzyme|nr:VOC family protein [Pseudonocardiaceae bacterium]